MDVVSHLGVGLADVILADAIAQRADAAGLGKELTR
jgi:ornithine cyclodeaminase/alanine dehydrogenase-like protein (mu-crystallin family)